ncbi:replication-relaxation family protein [Streptomyces sp. V1I6]|uniref:replication-relaxation family protein n=1 Tax=Streptomyces sp. V1I6 TaxID=3042273 RepID=UPI0027882F19|nr:hypothetical protein [Streptomyces sp. V1I6]
MRHDLWNLTAAGPAAASELGCPVREMSGTAQDAAKAGAAHALAVTDTIDAFRQSPPLATKPVARRTTKPPEQRMLPVRPQGLGHLRGWETEMALPVAGTCTAPAKGSLRSDAVLVAPEDGMPVLFVEVDNHTEPAEVVARSWSATGRSSAARSTAAATSRCGRRCGRTPAAAATRRWLSCSRRTSARRRGCAA